MKRLRMFSLYIAVFLLFSSISCYATENTSAVVLYKGDIDLDGSITAADALLALKHAAKLDAINTLIGDIDEDTTVNATDALYILKYAAKLITEFPGGNIITPEDTDITPVPTESTSPIPSETVSPVPSETASPVPSETTTPTPSETASPVPSETATPTPSETASPVPSETATPVPTEVPTPTPTLTPIESIKEYVKNNGFDGELGEKIYGYAYEDNTVTSTISYVPTEDKLIFELNYEETTDVEVMQVALVMKYKNGFDYTTLEARYEYEDFIQVYMAQAPIVPEEITTETEYIFTEISSSNCSDDEKAAILSMGNMYMEMALNLWNSILSNDMSVTLKDIGFINYNSP